MGNSSSSSTSGGGTGSVCKNVGKSPLNKRRTFIRFGTRKSKTDFSNILSDNNQSKDKSFHSAQEVEIWNSSIKNDAKTATNQSRFFIFLFYLIKLSAYFQNF